jgi:thiosulfate/3-mercaptopyruvate sulfurtransferase
MSADVTYPRADLLAEPEWLSTRLEDPALRVIDCGDAVAYARAHIPGAASLLAHVTRDLVAEGNWLKNPRDPLHVIDADQAATVFGALGIGPETTVVAYDSYNGSHATRLWWVLAYYGHDAVRVLNGGWQRWLEERRPATFRSTTPEPATFMPRPNDELISRLADVKRRHADPDVQVVNVLWPEQYDGIDNPFGNPRVGHIPGSVNVPIERFLVDEEVPTLKPAAELRSVFQEAGLGPDRETVFHCQAGVRTTMGVFVAALLGWDRVRAFDAAMAEWSRDPEAPLVMDASHR